MIKTLFLGLVSSICAACAVSSVEPLAIPLSYKSEPKTSAALNVPSCSSLARIQVDDQRTEKILGVRVHESKPLKADVTAATDPAAWVHSGVGSYLAQYGIHVAASGPTLVMGLDSLRTAENIWHRSGYDARVVLDTRLVSPSGKVCWNESVEGKSGNYGYSGSIENYQETLNGALDAASQHLVDSSSFGNALCHCSD